MPVRLDYYPAETIPPDVEAATGPLLGRLRRDYIPAEEMEEALGERSPSFKVAGAIKRPVRPGASSRNAAETMSHKELGLFLKSRGWPLEEYRPLSQEERVEKVAWFLAEDAKDWEEVAE
jgi:hypothetical protein